MAQTSTIQNDTKAAEEYAARVFETIKLRNPGERNSTKQLKNS